MLIHPRIALASGLAAAVGAGLLILGRIEGSLVAVVALVLAARAAPLSAAGSPTAVRALARHVETIPAWVALVVVATLRAGSPVLADIWGANGVAGLALARGSAATVAAAWAAAIACLLAIAVPAVGRGALPLSADPPWRQLEAIAVGLQVVVVAGVSAGPQVLGAVDVVPWIVATLVGAVLVAAGGIAATGARAMQRSSLVLAVMAVVLAIGGAAP